LANIINGTDTGSGGLITTGDSSDELQLQTAEVARVTLTNSAVVVNESGADVDFRVEGDTDANLLFVDAGNDAIGIGTSSPGNYRLKTVGAGFAFFGNNYFNVGIHDGSASQRGVAFGYNSASQTGIIAAETSSAASNLAFFTFGGVNWVEGMRIDSSGNLLVGTTSAFSQTGKATFASGASGNGLIVQVGNSYTAYQSTNASGTSAYYAAIWSNNGNSFSTCGTIQVSGSTTSYNTSSDYRLKENVAPMTGALAKVLELNPVTYTWKVDGSAGQGFIAHELQAVCSDAVSGERDETEIRQVEVSPAVPATYDEEGNELTPAVEAVYEEREVPKYQGVDTSFLVATLTAAIQELKAELDEAKARIAALETGA
jgi:hypothetical protein